MSGRGMPGLNRSAGLFGLLLISLSSQAAWLKSVEHNPTHHGSVFLLDFNERVDYDAFTLDQSPRLVIDFNDTGLFEGASLEVKEQSLVRDLRHGQHPGNILRLVFDLNGPAETELSWAGGGKRLVVSLVDPEMSGVPSAPVESVPPEPSGVPSVPVEPAPAPEPEVTDEPVLDVPPPFSGDPVFAEKSPPPVPDRSDLKHSWSGYFALGGRWFFQSPADARQHDGNYSFAFEPEYYLSWASGDQSLTIKPFIRADEHDDERTHWDLREFIWIAAGEGWEIQAGVGKVFWGVTEAYHLVDVINQTDLVENIDGEQKLGQPMLKLSAEGGLGALDLFILPYFRERTFPGETGRLRTQPRVEEALVRYESDDEERHLDFALRWYHSIGDWDIGLAHFQGTSRDPRLLPGLNDRGEVVLIPVYDQIEQTSLDLQATKGDWLWKLETLHRSAERVDDYWAATGGFEYTLWGVFDSRTDLGFLLEYMWDERERDAPQPFQDDVFSGVRWVVNDVDSTELLAGVIFDLDYGGGSLNIEASRRFGQNWKAIFQARSWFDTELEDPLYSISRDDYAELSLYLYF